MEVGYDGALPAGEAYDRLCYVERMAQVELYAMWTGKPLKFLPEAVVQETVGQFAHRAPNYGGRSNADRHLTALKQILDRKEPDYRA